MNVIKWFNQYIKNPIRYRFQKITRGFSDQDLWSLDSHLAHLILSRLIMFKKVSYAYPPDFESFEKWACCLDEMIFAMKFISSDEKYDCNDEEIFNRVQKGLDLFSKYFMDLWY